MRLLGPDWLQHHSRMEKMNMFILSQMLESNRIANMTDALGQVINDILYDS